MDVRLASRCSMKPELRHCRPQREVGLSLAARAAVARARAAAARARAAAARARGDSCMRSGCHHMGHKSRNCTHLIFRRSRGHSTSLPHLLHLRDSRTMNYSRGMAAAARVRAAAARAMVMPEHSWQYSPQTPHSKSYRDHCCADCTGNIVELRGQNCNQSSLCTSLLCK